ncbi:hypothetical protein SDC9_171359 [bioreactor metagenome]|uniref:Uncharacterized protein n=1 Tax=bioreactor metagenome TaxID=1076179 RepID=A0A645GCV3_9ZZZZ
MYPLFPLVYEEEEYLKFKIIRDPRAMDCPIVMNHLKISRVFIKAVSMATRYLLNDELTKNYVIALSEEILDVIKLNEYLKSNV